MNTPVNLPVNTPASVAPQRRLKIAILNRIFRPSGGGAERYSIALVEQLAQRHELHVFAQHIEHAWPGVHYHRIPAPLQRPRWINQLWFAAATWWATRRGFDVVHSHENTWHGQVQTVHVLPIKHNLLHARQGWRRALRWLKIATSVRLLVYLALEWARYAPRAGRVIVPTSASLHAIMAQTYPHTQALMQIVTPGVDALHPAPSAAEKTSARAQLGLPAQGSCILFVANDYRKKGLEALLQALLLLPPQCYLAVVGNAAQIAGFQDEVARLGLSGRIFFLGALDSVDVAYRAADCLAHPTLEDTFAMVVLEALAHGLPVVVSAARYCGITALLTHELDALILDNPRDATALAQALRRLVSDAALQSTLRQRGVRFAKAYLWPEVARKQESIYLSAARAR